MQKFDCISSLICTHRRVLSAKTPEEEFQEETVFELAGNDRAGLLAGKLFTTQSLISPTSTM